MLWKDVPGILTADPRLVPDARVIPALHHQEAAEVAHYGAKVLHPRALIPLAGTRIPLHVRSFLNPELPGTVVSARQSLPGYPVKALALLPKQAVVTVTGKGMVGVHGIAARTFAAVDAERLSVSTIFQGSSESSIGFTVPSEESDRAVRAVRKALALEIASGLIDGVQARSDMAVMAVVGDGMAGAPGIAGAGVHGAGDGRHQRRWRSRRARRNATSRSSWPPPPRPTPPARCMPPSNCRRSAAARHAPCPRPTWCCLASAGSAGPCQTRSRR